MQLDVRPLHAADRADWERLWAAYFASFNGEVADAITNLTWQRLMDPEEPMEAFGAFADGRLIGFALVVLHRSTHLAGATCYLEDLFVDEAARGLGAGRALLDVVHAFAKEHAGRLYWITASDNAVAQRLYKSFASPSGFVHYRLKFDPMNMNDRLVRA